MLHKTAVSLFIAFVTIGMGTPGCQHGDSIEASLFDVALTADPSAHFADIMPRLPKAGLPGRADGLSTEPTT